MKELNFEDYTLLKYSVKIILKVLVNRDSYEVYAQISKIIQKFEKKHIITRQTKSRGGHIKKLILLFNGF